MIRPPFPVRGQRGSYLVEAAIGVPLLLGLVFLIVDVGWTLFAKATLQHAVREGVRYAVTGRAAGKLGQTASIQQVVIENSAGLLSGQPETIRVRFYRPDNQAEVNDNSGGNVVVVSVEGYAIKSLLPYMHSCDTVIASAHAGDRLESSPPGGPPAL